MLPNGRRRPNYTSADIQAHLSQITLDPTSSSSALGQPPHENVEHLATVIKSLQETSTEQVYLRTLDRFVEEKEREIESICADNYEDFASSVSTLSTVRQGTVHLRKRIGELDTQIGDVGRALGEKKRSLLHQKKVSSNLDEAIETLQTCLRVLDLVNRVREMIKAGKHFGALRALEDLRSLPPTAISQTPFFIHILSSLPSLQAQIKSAVTESEKSWLFDIRESGSKIGKSALDAMESRLRKWRARKERDPSLGFAKVGGAIELVTNEKSEFDPLNNGQVVVDFKPLFQAIYIYDALECRMELQRNYQADRKTQADLILSRRATTTSHENILTTLPGLMEELVGFFIVENHVLRVTRDFRNQREVNDLWDNMCAQIVKIVGDGLKGCEELETFLGVKGHVLTFMQTLQSYGYDITSMTALLLTLFERYSDLLQRKYSADFDQIINEDDNQPMMVNDHAEFEQVVGVCWLATGEAEHIEMQGFPQPMPFSQTFPMCCINIRNFVDQFYQFVEGVTQNHREIDELLRRSLDGLLISHVSKNICARIVKMNNLSQIAQIVINIEHFSTACDELETVLMNLRTGQSTNVRTGGVINLQSGGSFNMALELAQTRIDTVIASKLDDFFEMAEYDWTPPVPASMRNKNRMSQYGRASPAPGQRSATTQPPPLPPREPTREPSMYLFEMITFLTAYVDSVLIMLSDPIKTRAYRHALEHINAGFVSYLTGTDVPKINEQALKNLVDDVAFIEKEIKRLDKPGLDSVFDEIKQSVSLILSEAVQAYLDPAIRQMSYGAVKPKTLKVILEKLARWTPDPRMVTGTDQERIQRRKREAEQIGRLIQHPQA